ncbi:hypothetical protein EUZ10_09625, partial [Campylobacter coli]|nr:hypothetical protein [Campylobacter coli]
MKKIYLKYVDNWYNGKMNEGDFYNNFIIRLLINRLSHKYEILFSDKPDYLIYGPFGYRNNYEHLNYECIRISLTSEYIQTDWSIADYGIDFDFIDFQDRHLRFPFYFLYHADDIKKAMVKHINPDFQRDKFCAYMVTDPSRIEFTPRDLFFKKLSLYKKVDSGGRHLNNIGGPIGNRYGNFSDSKNRWLKNYKFNICFENGSSPGYITEKLFQAYAGGCIPIYWGDISLRSGENELANKGGIKEVEGGGISNEIVEQGMRYKTREINQYIPRISESLIDYKINLKSFINAHDFSSWDELIDYIKYIDNDYNAYSSMLKEPVFLNDFNPVDFYEKKLVAFFDNIFSQDYKSAFRRKCGIHAFRKFEFMKTGIEVPILKKQLEAKNNTDYKIENLSQEIDNMRQTVVNYKINNFLSYKLGFAMYKLKNNIFYMLVM